MKKIISLVLSLLVACNLLCMTTAFAVDGEWWFTVGDFKFNIWLEGEIDLSVVCYIGKDANVVVPDKISVSDIINAEWYPYSEDYMINEVKACGDYVPVKKLYTFEEEFLLNPECVKSITIPESVEIDLSVDFDIVDGELVKIPGNIFENCPGIEVVGASDEVYRIAEENGYGWKRGTGSTTVTETNENYDTNEISVLVNGEKVVFDQQPVIIDGRTLVPLRAIFEKLGAKVLWDDSTQTVTAKRDEIEISLQIGSKEMYVNKNIKTLDVPAMLTGGRTLVPVRAISEAFGCDVDWIDETQTVVIIVK